MPKMNYSVPRRAEQLVLRYLAEFPVVAIVGPRQCGKSTLARQILSSIERSVYLDLELPSDRARLRNPEAYLGLHDGDLVCLDEIQRTPEVFSFLRALIDRDRRPGRYLVLGSASPGLLRQTSESLAGRIVYLNLTPFTLEEVATGGNPVTGDIMQRHWVRGGFPPGFLAVTDNASFRWREQFIQTFLERDLPALGIDMARSAMERLWTLLASGSGTLVNKAKLADAIGISPQTVTRYIDILGATYIARVLRPRFPNVKKRLVRSPKVYLRDSGLLHTLLGIASLEELYGHRDLGASWESYAVEQLLSALPDWRPSFYRTSGGAEVDLVLEHGKRCAAVEIKASPNPRLTRGFYEAVDDIEATECYVVAQRLREGNEPAD